MGVIIPSSSTNNKFFFAPPPRKINQDSRIEYERVKIVAIHAKPQKIIFILPIINNSKIKSLE